ncbi:helix-turn-helix domain protein [Thermoanaerobacterium phage THSA-485A]|uniref:helix-turn-helix domain protein n=1 Tax=Thermoanaerobacterium phage THSA-485A TaxID=1126885 RepID=UPI000263F8EA|nr:helix-turn-helix domain protein [Thermoanaerobacterium phage THSA-485A]AFK87735.1 helix-turn-helix domain protein [Thermoanaerobacterium phage THSA-485A]
MSDKVVQLKVQGVKKLENNIRQAIKNKNLKISDVIEQTGLSKSYFYDVLNGKSVPTLTNAIKISKVIGVPLDELFPALSDNKEVI